MVALLGHVFWPWHVQTPVCMYNGMNTKSMGHLTTPVAISITCVINQTPVWTMAINMKSMGHFTAPVAISNLCDYKLLQTPVCTMAMSTKRASSGKMAVNITVSASTRPLDTTSVRKGRCFLCFWLASRNVSLCNEPGWLAGWLGVRPFWKLHCNFLGHVFKGDNWFLPKIFKGDNWFAPKNQGRQLVRFLIWQKL